MGLGHSFPASNQQSGQSPPALDVTSAVGWRSSAAVGLPHLAHTCVREGAIVIERMFVLLFFINFVLLLVIREILRQSFLDSAESATFVPKPPPRSRPLPTNAASRLRRRSLFVPPLLLVLMRIVAFTGMPGAGKSVAVEEAKARGIPVVRMGDLVWEEVRRRGLELTDQNVGGVATEMRKTAGADVWAVRTVERMGELGKDHPKLVVVDGVRNYEEVEAFRRLLGHNFVLVAVHAPETVRYDRLLRRGRADDTHVSQDDIRRRDEREMGWGLLNSIEKADRNVVNEGDLVAFRKAVALLLKEIG